MNINKLNRVGLMTVRLNTVYLNTVSKPDDYDRGGEPESKDRLLLLENEEPLLLEDKSTILLEIQNVMRKIGTKR